MPRVTIQCPKCGHVWVALVDVTCIWWGRGLSAEQLAVKNYCIQCNWRPPMTLVPVAADRQLSLFDEA